MRRFSRSSSRLLGLPLVLALVVGVLAALGVAGPASAAPADGTYITCTQDTEASKPTYIVVGGSPIWVRSWAAMGKWTTSNPHPTPTSTNCASLPLHPKDGTFFRGWAAGAATGPTYEIVGGAPITVHSWSNLGKSTAPTVEKVDAASIPAATAAPVTKDGTVALRGYINAKPAAKTTTFRGHATQQYYRLDSALHPVPQAAAAPSGTIDVDQTSINACERMVCDPVGDLESSISSVGVLHLEGYAMDFPQATSVNVQVQIDQGSTYTIAADQPGAYAPAGAAGRHNFSWNLATGTGTHEVCATVIGSSPGAATEALGCSYPSVNAAKPGKVKKVRLKAQGHGKVKVKWKRVKANGSLISAYLLRCGSGHAKQLPGAKIKHTLKHQHRGRRLSCKVRAVSNGGYGKWSKKSKTVTVR